MEVRRRFPRRRLDAPVAILFQGQYEVVTGFEISEGGLLAQTPFTIADETSIVVSFYVPGRDFVAVRAQVIYSKKASQNSLGRPTIGVRFNNLQFHERRHIRDFIADKTAVEVPYE